MKHLLLICEDGWEGIREFSIHLSHQGMRSSVIVKGDPGKEVRQMISSRPGVKNYFFHRVAYRVLLIPFLLMLYLWDRFSVVCVGKERTYKTLSSLKKLIPFQLYLFHDTGKSSKLVEPSGEEISLYEFK